MKGDKPLFRLIATAKDKSLPKEERFLELATSWPGNFEDSHQTSVGATVKIKVGNKVLTFGKEGEFYLDLKAVKAPKAVEADDSDEDESVDF